MKKLLFSSVLLFVFTVINAQPFQNTFDLGSDDYANMSVVDANGNIYSVGSSNFIGAGGYDAILVKSDTSGNFVWHKQYGGAGTEFGTALTQTYDGFAIAGRSNSFANSPDILLVKTDNNGDLQWTKTYGSDTNDDYATYIATTLDSGFVITGLTRSYGNGGQEVFILKTDSDGNVEWFKTYGSNSDEFGYFVQQVDDGGYVVCGVSRGFGGAGQNDMYLVKTDSMGTVEVQFLIGGSGDDEARRLLFPVDDKLIIVGKTKVPNNPDDIFVGELNTQTFTFNWINTYGGIDNEGIGSIVQIPGEGYVVAGITQSFGSGQEGLIFLIDTAGAVNFSAKLEGSADEIIQDIILTNDGGIATGFSNSFGGTANDIYLAKIGDAICYSSDITLDVTPLSHSIAGPTLPVHTETTASVSANAVTLTQSTTTATVIDICSIAQALSADAGGDVEICSGDTVMIGGNPTANDGTPPYTYAWSPSIGLDDPTAANPNALLASTATYLVTITDSLGETATDEVTVLVDPSPTAVINPPGPNICEGQNVTLTASGGTSYSWSTGATTAVIVEFPTTASTSYSVTITNDCGSTATATEIVNSFTRPTVTITPINPTICDTSGTGVTLQASGAETYIWTPSTGLSSDTSSNPVALPDTTTTYTITGKNGHCAGNDPATVTVTVDICSGIKDLARLTMNLFPNPAKDEVNINILSDELSEGLLTVNDIDGKVALDKGLNLSAGMNEISVNTSDLTSGFYFVRIKTSKAILIGKVIIE